MNKIQLTYFLIWMFGWGVCLMGQANVGIGIPIPTERLHVAGNLRLDGAFMPGANPGTQGEYLLSQGSSTPPIWRGLLTLWALDAWNPATTSSLGWTCNGCSGPPPWITDCGSELRMLGGYNMCSSGCSFEKTFTDLPPHPEVYVEVLYFSIDSWDHTDDWGVRSYSDLTGQCASHSVLSSGDWHQYKRQTHRCLRLRFVMVYGLGAI